MLDDNLGMMDFSNNPFQEIIKLHADTLQSFSYLMPQELAQINTPVELFEKQMELYVKNSAHLVSYLNKLTSLLNQNPIFTSNALQYLTPMNNVIKQAASEAMQKASIQKPRKKESKQK